jgi:hypothetical protein
VKSEKFATAADISQFFSQTANLLNSQIHLNRNLVQINQPVYQGIDGKGSRTVNLKLTADIAPVRHHRIHGYKQRIGNLLVAKALGHLHHNILLAVAKVV